LHAHLCGQQHGPALALEPCNQLRIRQMQIKMLVTLGIFIILFLLQPLKAQDGWPGILFFNEERTRINKQETFLIVFGTAVASYALSKFIFKYENLNFYQVRIGYFGAAYKTSILVENVGLEKRVAPWF
jgi:hypothetical protein